jgi:hypothetical protein
MSIPFSVNIQPAQQVGDYSVKGTCGWSASEFLGGKYDVIDANKAPGRQIVERLAVRRVVQDDSEDVVPAAPMQVLTFPLEKGAVQPGSTLECDITFRGGNTIRVRGKYREFEVEVNKKKSWRSGIEAETAQVRSLIVNGNEAVPDMIPPDEA